ncbi:hypothetical protein JOF41_002633 [Saccharothrix coeruleofusca]|uniref:hypothetical protein n=1 Tax=Saccharothrix coeruleofusca TaxID=33919 RepID=UPI001AE6DF29|nr:hypothetical protein [Saccharothrix coeruleofusca]MBP2336455.1 hypothetical protein [Saccharothrix coeruleofusca]
MDVIGSCAAVEYANELHATVERCALRLGWPLVLVDGNVHLATDRGVVGLLVGARFGGHLLGELRGRGWEVPVLALPGVALRWAFLVRTPVGPVPRLPAWARVVSGPQLLPLPPSVTGHGPARWVHAPTGHPACVPPFAAAFEVVLAAASHAIG